MSSERWPHGALSSALADAHRKYPHATAPQLAAFVGCTPGSARMVLRSLDIRTRPAKRHRIVWTGDMKRALLNAVLDHRPVRTIAEDMGLHPAALASGAFEIIRDLREAGTLRRAA